MSDTPLLRRNIVEHRTGLGRSSIYSMMKQGRFPLPLRVGSRAVRWRETDIVDFLDSPADWGIRQATRHAFPVTDSNEGVQ